MALTFHFQVTDGKSRTKKKKRGRKIKIWSRFGWGRSKKFGPDSASGCRIPVSKNHAGVLQINIQQRKKEIQKPKTNIWCKFLKLINQVFFSSLEDLNRDSTNPQLISEPLWPDDSLLCPGQLPKDGPLILAKIQDAHRHGTCCTQVSLAAFPDFASIFWRRQWGDYLWYKAEYSIHQTCNRAINLSERPNHIPFCTFRIFKYLKAKETGQVLSWKTMILRFELFVKNTWNPPPHVLCKI